MKNGMYMVARLPFRGDGPRGLMAGSQLATMAYGKVSMPSTGMCPDVINVSSHTNILNPELFAWSCDESNPVGAKYISMALPSECS